MKHSDVFAATEKDTRDYNKIIRSGSQQLYGTQNSTSLLNNAKDLMKASIKKRGRFARSAENCARTTYTFNIDNNRRPRVIQRAVCGTCKDETGSPSCHPMYIETRVFRYQGQSKGKDYWMETKELIPVFCQCS